jgi:hypothetical protein
MEYPNVHACARVSLCQVSRLSKSLPRPNINHRTAMAAQIPVLGALMDIKMRILYLHGASRTKEGIPELNGRGGCAAQTLYTLMCASLSVPAES